MNIIFVSLNLDHFATIDRKGGVRSTLLRIHVMENNYFLNNLMFFSLFGFGEPADIFPRRFPITQHTKCSRQTPFKRMLADFILCTTGILNRVSDVQNIVG